MYVHVIFFADDEAEQKKKKKKMKAVAEEVGSALSKQAISGIEIVERVKKSTKIAKQIIRPAPPIVSPVVNESVKDLKDVNMSFSHSDD